ncbi:MAG: TetR/AcrR family transcriptional regulator [Sphingomonas sp.]|nr:TetR/AcrR family transcriptional regulator [Sphingomonas sp.]
MLALVRDGHYTPSAAQVADVAGVGLRTVFRHFDEMDALYREIATHLELKVMPMILQPFTAQEWRGRLREMIDRRIEVYETILPFRIASSVRRFQSDFLLEGYNRQVQLEKSALNAILPPRVLSDAALSGAMEVALSFQCWRRLRHDQGLAVPDSRAVVTVLVDALIVAAGPDA